MMNKYLVVTSNGARANFYSLGGEKPQATAASPSLVSEKSLVNPEMEMTGEEFFTDVKSGTNHAPTGGGVHRYDDHRFRHMAEVERRFAREIISQTVALINAKRCFYLVVAANPEMLGYMRPYFGELKKTGVELQELSSDVSKLPPKELYERLVKKNLLPDLGHSYSLTQSHSHWARVSPRTRPEIKQTRAQTAENLSG
jgi:protein required for attachment to host cells